MLGREHDEVRAEDGVDPCCKDFDDVAGCRCAATCRRDAKRHTSASGSADPIALHRENFFGPALHLIERGEELVGVGRDAEVPLLEFALGDGRSTPPATTLN